MNFGSEGLFIRLDIISRARTAVSLPLIRLHVPICDTVGFCMVTPQEQIHTEERFESRCENYPESYPKKSFPRVNPQDHPREPYPALFPGVIAHLATVSYRSVYSQSSLPNTRHVKSSSGHISKVHYLIA